MPDILANGVRLFYQQAGAGPDVVLIHAVTSNQAIWAISGLFEILSATYRVTSYDLRGHGGSERPQAGYTSKDMACDFASLHEQLELGPSLLVGHSFGGVSAIHAASLYPAKVAGVIVSDSFFPCLKSIEPNFGKPAIWNDLRERYLEIGVDLGDTIDFTRLFQTTRDLDATQAKALADLVGPIGRGWIRQLKLLAETRCGEEVLAEAELTRERLIAIRQPVAALYDEFSPFQATGRWLGEHLPDCQTEIIPAAKHLAILENTEGFHKAVLAHLKRMAKREASLSGSPV